MPFARPTREQLLARAIANIETRLPGADARLRRSNLNVLAYLNAEASHGMYGYIDWIARQINPFTMDIDALQSAATLWLDQPRKPAAPAIGNVQFTGTSGTVIAAGTVLTRSDSAEFITSAEGEIAGGVAIIAVGAVVPGQASNTDAGSVLSLASPIAGIDSNATVQAPGLSGGADVEDIEALRARLIARMQLPPHGGSRADYESWALEVPGVTRVWVMEHYLGTGTVGIFFVRDDDTPIIPDAGEVTTVQAYIDERRQVGMKGATVIAPVGDALALNIQLLIAVSQSVKDAIEAEIVDLLQRVAAPGGTILISQIREAISIAAGEVDHVLISPTANVTHSAGHMAVPGPITWS